VDRVAVVGCAGSGKTYVAARLAAGLGLPVTHLDAVFFDDAWTPLPPAHFATRQRELVAGPRWVIDGNYLATLPIRAAAADVVVFLDAPTWRCLAAVLLRRARHGGGQDPASGRYSRVTWRFLRYVAGYRRSMRPRVLAVLADAGAVTVTLQTRRDVARLVAAVAAFGAR
jgi:adenylate kinase family enzyme